MGIRNHEHYMDTTAYFALRNTDNKRGEVWEADFNGDTREVLVLADHDDISTVLSLFDFYGVGNNKYAVQTDGVTRYTSVQRVSYLAENRFLKYVCNIDPEEFQVILWDVADELGIKPEKEVVVKEKIVEVEKIVEAEKRTENDDFVVKMAIREAEIKAELYKSLYEGLLADLIGGAQNG